MGRSMASTLDYLITPDTTQVANKTPRTNPESFQICQYHKLLHIRTRLVQRGIIGVQKQIQALLVSTPGLVNFKPLPKSALGTYHAAIASLCCCRAAWLGAPASTSTACSCVHPLPSARPVGCAPVKSASSRLNTPREGIQTHQFCEGKIGRYENLVAKKGSRIWVEETLHCFNSLPGQTQRGSRLTFSGKYG